MRLPLRSVACFVAVASSAAAQSRIDAGVSAGVVKLTDQRSEQVVSGVLEYAPRSWLSLYAIPAVVHVSDGTSGRTVSSSGLGDLPVVAAVSRAFPTPWSPTLGAALVAVLPTGNASDRKSTRLNSSHSQISYAVFCLKKKKTEQLVTPSVRMRAAAGLLRLLADQATGLVSARLHRLTDDLSSAVAEAHSASQVLNRRT